MTQEDFDEIANVFNNTINTIIDDKPGHHCVSARISSLIQTASDLADKFEQTYPDFKRESFLYKVTLRRT